VEVSVSLLSFHAFNVTWVRILRNCSSHVVHKPRTVSCGDGSQRRGSSVEEGPNYGVFAIEFARHRAFFAHNNSCLIRLHSSPSGVSHVVTSVITEQGARK